MSRPCRWGILGTATIARKNWKAVRNAGNATLTAVASRTLENAKRFLYDCQGQAPFERAPQACGSYDDLLARDDVDAVYIPLPTGIRKEWVIRAAEAGKHVLCEKPCASTAADLREMLEACRRRRVQFMDGVMFMHGRRLQKLREVLDDGQSVGAVRRIAAQFSFRAPDDFLQNDIRASSTFEPLGCLGDLGWYAIRFILWTMNFQLPRQVSGRLLEQHGRADSPTRVPMEFAAELLYPGGVSASLYCSFLAEHQQWANISGTHGNLHVSDFVLPYFGSHTTFDVTQPVFQIQGCDFNMENRTRRYTVPEYSNSFPGSQEANMIRRFSEIVRTGRLEPQWPEIALKTQLVADAALASAREGGQLQTIEE